MKKRKWSLILSAILSFAMVFGTLDAAAFAATADPEDVELTEEAGCSLTVKFQNAEDKTHGKVQYSSDDGTTWTDVTDDINSVEASGEGQALKVRIVPNDGYRIDWTAGMITSDAVNGGAALSLNNDTSGVAGGLGGSNGYVFAAGTASVVLEGVEFRLNGGGGGGGTRAKAKVTVSGLDGTWSGKTATWEPGWDRDMSTDTVTMSYGQSYVYTVMKIGNEDPGYPGYRCLEGDYVEGKNPASTTINVEFDSNQIKDNKVNMVLASNWAYRYEEIQITPEGGSTITYNAARIKSDLLNYDNRAAWLGAFGNQNINLTIPGVPVPALNGDGTYHYDIKVKIRPITLDECFIGNFLWQWTRPEDEDSYIGNSDLELIQVKLPDADGGETYTEAQLKAGNTPKVVYEVDTGRGNGEMVVPEGSVVTMRISPHYGYQVTSFGINNRDITTGDAISVFSFKIAKANFHLKAKVEHVADAVKADSKAVESGNITLGGAEATMASGSARLDVKDANVSDAVKTKMADAADGYVVNDYLDVDLYNTVYKGTSTATWDTEVKDLSNPATISLGLESVAPGSEVAFVHEKHDGSVEVIPAEYDEKTKTYNFKTKSFSNYAIAVKGGDAVDMAAVNDVIENLYEGILGRASEETGKKYWAEKIASRETCGAALISGFINSEEFVNKNLNDADYVKALYKAFFKRDPREDEVKSWTDMIAAGAPRTEIMAGFVNSQEYINTCEKMNISKGTMEKDGSIKYNVGVYNFVQRCYDKGLGRRGETAGVEDWTYRINSKNMTPKAVAADFLHSEEFTNKKLDNTEYVKVLYRLFLGREAEDDGLKYWLNELNTRSRDDIISGFSDSAEFGDIMKGFGLE